MKNRAAFEKRLQGSQVVNQKRVSKVIFKQCMESFSIERKRGRERKNNLQKKEAKQVK